MIVDVSEEEAEQSDEYREGEIVVATSNDVKSSSGQVATTVSDDGFVTLVADGIVRNVPQNRIVSIDFQTDSS